MNWKLLFSCYLLACIFDVRAGVPPHCHHFVDKSSALETVECFGKQITRIPPGIPNTTQALYIHNAKISSLHNGSFDGLVLLQRLRLISCEIQRIQSGTFRNLENLSEMYLNQNYLQLSKSVYVSGIFSGQQNLRVLHLGRNSNVKGPNIAYPESVWKDLPNLTDLSIDGLFTLAFPAGFSKLISLRRLTLSRISCYCHIYYLQKKSFSALAKSNLRYLDLSICEIHIVDALVFADLQRLETVIVFHQYCSLQEVENLLSGINQTSIQYLQMSRILDPGSYTLTSDILKPLKGSSLKHLYLDDNCLTWIDQYAFKHVPKSLETLSLKGNYLLGDSHATIPLYALPNFTTCSISILMANMNASSWNFPLPFALKELTLSGTHTDTTIPPINFSMGNNLRSLTWTNSTIHNFSGPVRGLSKLEYFSLANVNCKYISRNYFEFFQNLKYINLSRNFLSEMLSADDSGEYFIGLTKVEVLDISKNGLRRLSTSLLLKSISLKELYIQQNSLVQFRTKIGHLKNLRYIDISTNSLSVLEDTTISALSLLMNANNLTLDISNNPLSCSCQTLHFLRWMQTNRDRFRHYESYTCSFQNGSDHLNVDAVTTDLQYRCASYTRLLLIASFIIAIFLVILMAGLFYRYHMHMKYWFHVVRRNFRKNMERQTNDFKYDAFVSYEESVEGFVLKTMLPECENRRQLRLCIHCRDFMPGTAITDNIVGAIQCSRKSVFIISKEFLKSEWCRYEFNMARMEHIYSGRSTIVVVMYEPVEELPLEIMEAVSSETYINYENRDAFWDILASSFKGEQI